ncbi:MAG: insulinase family protein [Bacteroidales bacterium]|nr:insulinase family protein [Bacteroidales bacterium]
MRLDRSLAPALHPFAYPGLCAPEPLRLSNGIPCSLFHQEDYRIVRLDLRVQAGACHQSEPGLALATVKMLQEGTQAHPSESWMECLDFEGAFLELTSNRDTACISVHFPSEAAEPVLNLLKEMLLCPLFSEERLRIVQVQQQQTLAIHAEKTAYVAYRALAEALFGSTHPYGSHLKVEDVEAWDTARIAGFFKRHYVPSAMRVYVAGNLTPALRRQLDRTLGSLPCGGEVAKPVVGRDFLPPVRKRIAKAGSVQSSICMGRVVCNRAHPDWMRLCVTNRILGGYFGSRLMTEIRERSGLAYGIYSHAVSLQHAGMLYIAADVNAEAETEAVAKIRAEMRRLCDEPMPEEELARVKRYESGSLLRSFDGLFAQMERCMEADAFGMDASYWERYFQTLAAFTCEDVRETARRYLDPNQMSEVVVGPPRNT